MKCKHCGADNFNESKFCFQCGQELSSDDVQHDSYGNYFDHKAGGQNSNRTRNGVVKNGKNYDYWCW